MVSSEYPATDWYKSSYSGGSQADCLEVCRGHARIPVRDSKSVPGPAVLFSTVSWSAFVTAVRQGEFGVKP